MSEEDEIKEQEKIDRELEKSEKSDNGSAKTHTEILSEQICEGHDTYNKSPKSIWLSSFTAGLEIGFSFLMLCSLFYFVNNRVSEEVAFKLISFVYPIGFILVILGRSILFTEQTSLLTLPVLSRKRKVKHLLKIWAIVIIGNLMGGWLIASVMVWIGPKLGIFDNATVLKIGLHVSDYSPWLIFISAILAGWLMALLSWLLTSTKDTISKIVLIFIITSIMSFASLHHSIIGSIEVFAAFISSTEVNFGDYSIFELLALAGNAIGGVVFVALLKYRAFTYNISGGDY